MHPFEVMAEPVRRRIVDLVASGEHTAGQVAEVIGREFRISRTAISKHLRVLRDGGFVAVRSDVQWRWYRLDLRGIESLEHDVADLRDKYAHAVGWDADAQREFDPLAGSPPVYTEPRRRGPGRPHRRGMRGTQRSTPEAPDPELGLFRPS